MRTVVKNSLEENAVPAQDSHAQFGQTHWSLVLSAAGKGSRPDALALNALCRQYWYPIYAFLRRRGYAPANAQDLTQGFFARLLAKERLQTVDPAKGKFRTFLLTCLTNYVHDERDRATAKCRGGDADVFSIDAELAERRYELEPADLSDPSKLFERKWACELANQVLTHLREECINGANRVPYERLEPFLTEEPPVGFYRETALQLNCSEGALRVALHRLRRRFGELLRSQIARTVSSSEEIDDEIRHLFAALGS